VTVVPVAVQVAGGTVPVLVSEPHADWIKTHDSPTTSRGRMVAPQPRMHESA